MDASLIRTLEEGGLTRPAAEALTRRRSPRDDLWMLAYAALPTALLVGGFGWTAAQFSAIDGKFETLENKFDRKFEAVDSKLDEHSERLTRIETLLIERLPAPQ